MNTQTIRRTNAKGGSAKPSSRATHSKAEDERDNTSRTADAASQLTEYSTRIWDLRTENKTSTSMTTLNTVIVFSKRSMDYSFLRRPSIFRMFTKTPSRT